MALRGFFQMWTSCLVFSRHGRLSDGGFHRAGHALLRRSAFTAMALLLSAALFAVAAEPPLHIAVEKEYRPFSYTDGSGKLVGFDVEILTAVCAVMQRECVITPMPFEDILPAVVKGDVDMAGVGFVMTPERQKIVDFTDPYFRSRGIFIEKPGALKGTSLEDMKGRRVGVQPGSIQEEYLKKTYGENVILVPQTAQEDLFKDLQERRSEVIFVDGLPGYAQLKTPLGEGLETVGSPVSSSLLPSLSHMVVSKSRPGLCEQLNKAIKAIVNNGEYGKISFKYFDFNVY